MSHTIAVGAIFIECNHLGGLPTEVEHFEQCELLRGEQVTELRNGNVGGMLDALDAATENGSQINIAPLLYASCCARGPLTAGCYATLKQDFLDRLEAVLPVDAVLLPLHGSAAAESAGDLEGDLITSIRKLVGPQTPIVGTLDLHAHVTEEMVRGADALLGLETYPHVDWYATGRRAAQLVLEMLAGRVRPTMALAKVPVVVSAIYGNTAGDGPFADVMRFAKSLELQEDVLSTSAFLVHPYLDLPGMGGGGLVVTDDDLPAAMEQSRKIAMQYWNCRNALEPPLHTPEDAVREGLSVDGGPIVLIETADCCGGGAAGDSVASLKALLSVGVDQLSLVPVVDPAAAAACHQAGVGSQVRFDLGHQLDPQWGTPLAVCGTVLRLGDGHFTFNGGAWDGRPGEMGPSAVLEVGAVQILITSLPSYDWTDEQFQAMQMDYRGAKFVVAKNPMNYRQVYTDLAARILFLNTPGPTPPTLRFTQFQHLQRPYFPADSSIPDLEPTILH